MKCLPSVGREKGRNGKEFEESKYEMLVSPEGSLRPEPKGTGLPEGHMQSRPSLSRSTGQRVKTVKWRERVQVSEHSPS